jgi:N-acetylmuramoyl-L-alanine amidase
MPKYIVDHIPKTTPHNRRPGTPLNPQYLTIHSTGNAGSTAKGERSNLTRRGNEMEVSFHVVVDDKEAIECIPFNEVAFHAYSSGNRVSIGLEMCESGNRSKTLQNAIALSAKVLKDHGWNESKLRRHYDWPRSNGKRKSCPGILLKPELRKNSWETWEWFISEVKCQLHCEG